MPAYATLLKLSSKGLKDISKAASLYEEGKRAAEKIGVKLVCAYATLGPCDAICIYEAPNEKVAARLALWFATKMGGSAETWTLIPMEEFEQIT